MYMLCGGWTAMVCYHLYLLWDDGTSYTCEADTRLTVGYNDSYL